jgi:large subunit ribosomal protein L35
MANKLKTHSGAKKRFKVTKSGKITSKKQGNNHLLTNKGKTNKKFSYGKQLVGAAKKAVESLLH